MNKKRWEKVHKKGVTLIELIIVIALMGLIFAAGSGLFTFGFKVHNMTTEEFDIQSAMRIMSLNINTSVRNSAGAFILHRDHDTMLTEGWNYIMLSGDKSQLIEYKWNEATGAHVPTPIFSGIMGVTLDLEFIKNDVLNEDKLLEYILTVNENGKTRTIDTELESVNALQVIDRSYGETANVLAYRNDQRLDEISNAQAVVAMVLDKSGSMGRTLENNYANDASSDPDDHSRLKKLKAEAQRLIDELAKNPNIYVSINPFDSTGNASNEMMKAQVNNSTNTGLTAIIDGLSAGGGTNTGDGIRRAYYRLKTFNELDENLNKTNKNFLIILVDGVTTFASIHENVTAHEISFSSDQGTTIERDGKTYVFDRVTGFWFWRTYYYRYNGPIYTDYVIQDGNIQNNEGGNNTYYATGRYFGDGASLDPYGTEYVDLIGSMVRQYKEGTNEAVQAYVIGFSAVTADYGSLEDIAFATRGDTTYYTAGSSEALEEIFRSIQKEISDALWHIGGPN